MNTTPAAPSGEQNLDHLEALAPCPFCRQPGRMHDGSGWYGVGCDTIHAGVMCHGYCSARQHTSAAAAAAAWNRRAAPAGLSTALAEVTAKLEREAAASLSLGMENRDLRDQLARRAAPVSAPIAGDALRARFEQVAPAFRINVERSKPFPEKYQYQHAQEMWEFWQQAALANQPAPTAAPEQVAQGADEAFIEWMDGRLSSNPPKPATAYEAYIEGRRAALSQPSEAAPLVHGDYVLMPRRLTAENGAKAAMIGEFHEEITVRCPDCDGADDDHYCASCNDEGTAQQAVPVQWDTIKQIYAKAVELLAAPSLPAAAAGDERERAMEIVRSLGWEANGTYAVTHRGDKIHTVEFLAIIRAALAHQPAQEQAEPVAAGHFQRSATGEWMQVSRPMSGLPGAVILYHGPDWPAPSQAAQHEAGDERAAMALLQEAARAWNNERDTELDAVMERAEVFLIEQRAASPVVRAQSEESADWGRIDTVGDMVRNLLTLDQAGPIFAAFHTDLDGKRVCRTRPVTISRERVVDGKWVDPNRIDVPYAHIVWAKQDEPAGAQQAHAGADETAAAARDVLAERQRQVEKEGWTPAHDDQYELHELSLAASCYVLAGEGPHHPSVPGTWPWEESWWKPGDDRRNLVKAGALILADIERLDRAAIRAAQEGGA
ncbi:Lar family restriction alleviation protein [Telluria beijingensis]|uniref:Lar family restriction alleviation protein n=1 Tax=Telluria beijingensis TaxID=3068633 RepID=UPI0027960455|nr:Lar family restriction alleviation protein [Massilia sp. REN29]